MIPLSVFTKSWPTLPIPQLAALVKSLGFDGVELPVRLNFQVTLATAARDLPLAVKQFADHGLKIFSIAAKPEAPLIEAAAAAQIPIIRIMLPIDLKIGYLASIGNFQKRCDALIPLLDRTGVTLGLQNHCDIEVTSAASLLVAIEPFDPRHVAAILDIAHCALSGEPEALAIDTVFARLCMVNLKNALRLRTNPTDIKSEAQWQIEWVPAREGFASWSKTIQLLKDRRYAKPLCLTAEYSDEKNVTQFAAADAQYARQLLGTM